ncbi:unnamed protein product [Chondrus crispus]|uniref:Uncharacterized protein n=1 Tax=Chondrus crispus TaxID=2769 RepID=R7Q632_CHOCR|nr:unnamed protein product [Chondrus crispus]CDF33308.1 unnamed protein product [Chondrus crispus]|eukprot:XP_005713111.1 unnamed protein product [Chondrus crispus]
MSVACEVPGLINVQYTRTRLDAHFVASSSSRQNTQNPQRPKAMAILNHTTVSSTRHSTFNLLSKRQ